MGIQVRHRFYNNWVKIVGNAYAVMLRMNVYTNNSKRVKFAIGMQNKSICALELQRAHRLPNGVMDSDEIKVLTLKLIASNMTPINTNLRGQEFWIVIVNRVANESCEAVNLMGMLGILWKLDDIIIRKTLKLFVKSLCNLLNIQLVQ